MPRSSTRRHKGKAISESDMVYAGDKPAKRPEVLETAVKQNHAVKKKTRAAVKEQAAVLKTALKQEDRALENTREVKEPATVITKKSVGRMSKSVQFEGLPAPVRKKGLKRKGTTGAEPAAEKKKCLEKPQARKKRGGKVLEHEAPVNNAVDPEDEVDKTLKHISKQLQKMPTAVNCRGGPPMRWLLEGLSAGIKAFTENEVDEAGAQKYILRTGSCEHEDDSATEKDKEIEIMHLLVSEDFSSFDLYEGKKNFVLGWWSGIDHFRNAFHECKAGRIMVSHLKLDRISNDTGGSITIDGLLGDMSDYLKRSGKPHVGKELAELFCNDKELASLPQVEGEVFHHLLTSDDMDGDF